MAIKLVFTDKTTRVYKGPKTRVHYYRRERKTKYVKDVTIGEEVIVKPEGMHKNWRYPPVKVVAGIELVDDD